MGKFFLGCLGFCALLILGSWALGALISSTQGIDKTKVFLCVCAGLITFAVWRWAMRKTAAAEIEGDEIETAEEATPGRIAMSVPNLPVPTPAQPEAEQGETKRKRGRPKSAKPPKPKYRFVRSKVAGVTHRNSDGVSRQALISRFARRGTSITLIREPNNPYQRNALGVWIDGPGRTVQIGYIKSELLADVIELIDAGRLESIQIAEVTGGDPPRSFGVNIVIKKRI